MTSATLNAAVPIHPVPLKQDAAIIGLVGLAHGTSHFSHLLLAPLFPVFMRDFGLSFSDVGLLMSIFFVISGSGQAMAGFVVDRLGARPVLFSAVGLFLLAALAASQATGYGGLVLVAILAGLGNAPFHPADFTILNQRVSAARLGHAFSAHGLTGNLGWALAPVFLVGITALADWRVAYYAAALLYAGVLGLLYWQRDKLRTEVAVRHADAPKGAELAYLKLPVVWWCFAFFLLSTMTLAVVQSFAPSILKAVHGVSMEAATFTISAYMLCGAVGMLVGGFVAAYGQSLRWSSDRVVAVSMSIGALLLLLCATGWLGAVGTMVALAATGFAVGVGGPSRDMMIKKATPKGATGRVYGTVYSGLDVGFAISPLVFGGFMDRGWYALTLAGAALVLAISVYAAVGVGRRTN
ncbi:MAG: MFS transporter [Hydrogenophaga sp.]|jgi:MFS family permease|uniref:MFS transporter n=1 Tax=Hydrogenophaga sp. TaxID=1904254 RepID=UPI002723645E|nr:MFS transporter [Hydrogenophaga sp.]MDO9568539.1 MFS transporter [Hydrogenophaga sp.]MDP2221012.1 MFS transporter [Hydrogenophaga sp.]MDP3374187.1 MFS transporter [Hydrogenophaga sp.]MDP3923408.1 MFS transporter [Hydrogenophaga sp.]MDZ4237630.1 MFS transporter [Hydrogenophaga sp.]